MSTNNESAERRDPAPPDLKALIRRAKLDDAERSSVVAELRGAELARLELLRDQIEPLFAQVPEGAELFDHGLVPGEKPRLFVDIVSFIEMARDRRCYRFIQDTRAGTLVLAESEKIDTIAHEVANYLARRLIEREKALSAPPAGISAASNGATAASPETAGGPAATAAKPDAAPAIKTRNAAPWQILLAFIVGAIAGAGTTIAYETGRLDELWSRAQHLWSMIR